MKLTEAVEAFELGKTKDEKMIKGYIHEVASGGEISKDHIAPALYAKEEDAITEWFRAINQIAMSHDGAAIRWVKAPAIEPYQITMQDRRGTHRIVSDRYTVVAQIMFGE